MASTETFLSLAQGLEENLGKAVKQLKAFNDVSQNVNKSCSTINKEVTKTQDVSKKINDNFDNIGESTKKNIKNTEKWGEAIGKVKGYLGTMLGVFMGGKAILSFADSIAGAVELHQNMRDLSYQMGQGAKGAKYLENAVMGIAASTGFALEEVESMMKTLTEAKVPLANLKQLTIDSLRFGQITGANKDAVAQMTSSLVVMGGLGQKNISNMMGDLVQVQRAFGMAASDVTALTNHITDTTYVLRNMGKSAGEIEKFQKGTMKLAGAFASVGLKAQDATEIIENLLDPAALEDNALLYAKLGISIEDAMGGNIDPGQLTSGLQGIGKELQNMSGPQANAMAKALGVPLKQLRQMGNMDMSAIQKQFGGLTGSSDSLAKAQDDQATAQRDMAQVWEKIKGTIGNIVIKFMPIFDVLAKLINQNMSKILGWVNGMINSGFIEKFVNAAVNGIKIFAKVIQHALSFLSPKMMLIGIVALVAGVLLLRGVFSKTFASVKTDTIKVSKEIGVEMSKGISAGLAMGAEKSKEIYTAKMEQGSRVVGDGLKKRIIEGTHYAAISSAAEYQRLLGGSNTFGWAKSMNNNTAEWLDKIKNGAKPLSLFATYYRNSQDAIREKIKLSGIDYAREKDFLFNKNTSELALADKYQKRLEAIGEMTDKEQKSSNITYEKKRIEDELHSINTSLINDKAKMETLDIRALAAKQKMVEKLGPEERAIYAQELKVKQQILDDTYATTQSKIKEMEVENSLLALIDKSLLKQKESLEKKMMYEDLNIEEVEAYKKINNSLSENKRLTESNGVELKENESILEKTNKEMKEIRKEIDHAEKGASATGALFKNWKTNLKDAATGFVGLIGAGVSKFSTKLKDSVIAVGESLKVKLNPKNWVAAVRKMGEGSLVKGGLKVAGKVGKVGVMAAGIGGGLLGGLSMLMGKSETGKKVMEDLQKKIAEVMEKIMISLKPLIDNLLPVIMSLFDALLPPIVTLVNALLPPLLKVLGFLLQILGTVIEALGSMISVFSKDVGESIKSVGAGIKKAGEAMGSAADSMVEANKIAALQAKKDKISDSTTKTLTQQLGITVEESQKMTVKELVSHMRLDGKTNELKNEMIKNTIELGVANKKAKEQALRETLDRQILNMNSVKGTSKVGKNSESGIIFDELKRLVGSAGDTGTFGSDLLKNAEGIISQGKSNKISSQSVQYQLGMMLTDLNNGNFSVSGKQKDALVAGQSGRINQETQAEMIADVFRPLIENSGIKFGGSRSEIESYIATLPKVLKEQASSLNSKLQLTGQNDKDFMAQFEKVLKENATDEMTAAILLDQAKKNTTKLGSTVLTGGGAGGGEGIATKLYPAIIEATASGFIKTKDAESVGGKTIGEQQVDATVKVEKKLDLVVAAIDNLGSQTVDATNAASRSNTAAAAAAAVTGRVPATIPATTRFVPVVKKSKNTIEGN